MTEDCNNRDSEHLADGEIQGTRECREKASQESTCMGTLTSRRRFLGEGLGLCSIFLAALAGTLLVRYCAPPGSDDDTRPVTINRGALSPGRATAVMQGGRQVLVVVVREGSSEEIRAFSAVCTHLGCLVKWVPSPEVKCLSGRPSPPYVFYCPCHDGVFGPAGEVLAGPAAIPLEKVSLKLTENQVIVGG